MNSHPVGMPGLSDLLTSLEIINNISNPLARYAVFRLYASQVDIPTSQLLHLLCTYKDSEDGA